METQNTPRPVTEKRMEFIRKLIVSLQKGEVVIRCSNGGILSISKNEVYDLHTLDESVIR